MTALFSRCPSSHLFLKKDIFIIYIECSALMCACRSEDSIIMWLLWIELRNSGGAASVLKLLDNSLAPHLTLTFFQLPCHVVPWALSGGMDGDMPLVLSVPRSSILCTSFHFQFFGYAELYTVCVFWSQGLLMSRKICEIQYLYFKVFLIKQCFTYYCDVFKTQYFMFISCSVSKLIIHHFEK